MLDSFLKDLSELVNLDCGTANAAGVTRAAEIMKRHYDSIGFHTELVDLGPEVGKGLFATNRPGAEHYDILFNAHLDTVFPDGTAAARPMSREGNEVHGPGCSDCKSGVLAIFYAIRAARPEDLKRLSIAVCCNPDEETSSTHSTAWIEGIARKSTRALVCEAARPNGALVRSRKGSGTYFVTFHGRSAHAGNNPKAGRSAVMAACRFCLEVVKLQDPDGKGTTVSVGTITGGSASNVIPDTCRVAIDTRCWRDEDGDEIDRGLKEFAARSWGEDITAELVCQARIPAMPFTESTKELAGLITKAAEMAGFTASWVDAGGASDACHIARAGIPVLDGVGPAGGNFHSDKEFLLVDTIENRTAMITKFLTLI